MGVTVVQMFTPTVLTGSAATLYTVPTISGVAFGRGRIRFTNTSSSPVDVTAYGIPSGGTAGSGNIFCDQQAVPAYGNLDMDVPVLASAGFIQAFASTASVIVAHAMDGVLFY
jgi:hypothetical protein